MVLIKIFRLTQNKTDMEKNKIKIKINKNNKNIQNDL
jgi:hypothetical protein